MFKTYKTYYSFLLNYKRQYIGFTIALIFYGISGSIQPYFYKLFIDAIPAGNFETLLNILILFVGLRVLQVFLDMLTYFLGDTVMFASGRDARLTVFKKIQDLDFAYHASKSTGSLISAVKRGDGAFYSTFDSLNIDLPRIAINFLVVVGFFATINLQIMAIMIVSFGINIVIARYLIAYNMKKRAEFNKTEDHISSIITDNLINFETVKYFAKEEWERKRLKNDFKPWTEKLWGFANTFRLIDLTVGSVGNIGLFLVIFIALRQLISTELTPGEFILILGFITDFYPKFYQLIFRFRDLAKHYTDLQTYFAILDNEVLIKDPVRPVKKTAVKGEIEFKNVTFAYPEGKTKSLENFDLHIRNGQSVALVGRSGVGKTTLIKLLMRLYDIQKGEILIDGTSIKKFSKSQLRSFMGIVPQEPILFNNSIAFNIGYGADNPTIEEIKAAAAMAYLDDFIETLPKKYETNVGERGIKLSGGQKQRLAIARMILSNPDIIIFDEATSHLDSESEKAIQDAFWNAAKDKTTIIIAHRLATVVKADKIIVLEEGKIVETGSHRALLAKKNGVYKRFWDMQVDIE
ncbi:MAG: ABC transporter ATP-binding protein/permease [bacterium]|nr:ABC transporter ATP-binding protein/permease [bacterium]